MTCTTSTSRVGRISSLWEVSYSINLKENDATLELKFHSVKRGERPLQTWVEPARANSGIRLDMKPIYGNWCLGLRGMKLRT